jgi:hypothetical protein
VSYLRLLSQVANQVVTKPGAWEQTTMTDTISSLKAKDGVSYKLIERWLSQIAA